MIDNRRLTIYHMLLSRGFAGSERSTAESCNEQCKQHDVTVILRKGNRRRGVSIVDHLDSRVKIKEVSAQFFTRHQVKKLLERDRPDIIHTHLRRSTRVIAKLAPDAATVATLHIGVNGPHFASMDGIVCNARWQLQDLPPGYDGQVLKANNSIVPQPPLAPGQRQALRATLDADTDTYIIGAVGRYHPSKAWDTLIHAFKSVPAAHARLYFFGSGSQEEELRQLAASDSRIRFVGFRENIKDLYQTFDLVVCPSRFEPMPRVILEAMDVGTPVLASDIGGCRELIDDYGGFSFAVDDIADLTAKLHECIRTKPPRYRPDLSAHYIHNTNTAMLNFYRQLIARRQAAADTYTPGLQLAYRD